MTGQFQDTDVLAAAMRTYESVGWRRVTVEQVAVEAGLPPADVIRRFPSREHLGVAMFQQVLDRLPDEFADEVQPDLPLTDKLYFLLAHELRSLEPNKGFVGRTLLDLFNPLSPTARLQMPLAQQYMTLTTDLIRQSRSRGEISSFTLPWSASWGFWLLRAQVIAYWLADTSENSERTHAEAADWVDGFVRTLTSLRGLQSGMRSRFTDRAQSRRVVAFDLADETADSVIVASSSPPAAATKRAKRTRQPGRAPSRPPSS